MVHLAFVSGPGGSLFMEELLADVAAVVRDLGGTASCHSGKIADYADQDTVTVVVPHEYFLLAGPAHPYALSRTIAFGVEHPGTQSFENSAAIVGELAHRFEISETSVAEMTRRGVACERFVLGYHAGWDDDAASADRDIDVLHLGTADEDRLTQLAPIAAKLSGKRTELLLPPHEWMNSERPDFVIGERKRALLRRSRIILNLHRENANTFEIVRALDAIRCGCVVLTAPSTGLAPFVPGDHLLVSRPETMADVALAALSDPNHLADLSAAAVTLCREQLNMTESVLRLMDAAERVCARARVSHPAPPRSRAASAKAPAVKQPADNPMAEKPMAPKPMAQKPMALWVPCERDLPVREFPHWDNARRANQVPRRPGHAQLARTGPASSANVDVICVAQDGDGPLGLTLESLRTSGVNVAVHVASDAVALTDPTIATRLQSGEAIGRGLLRNALLDAGSAPFVLVIDAGDEILGTGLANSVAALQAQPDLDIAYPMAVTAARPMIVNALIPELRRLQAFAYLGRGYLVRRSFLEHLGGFSEDSLAQDHVDYEFWLRATAAPARAALLRQVGIRLAHQPVSARTADAAPHTATHPAGRLAERLPLDRIKRRLSAIVPS